MLIKLIIQLSKLNHSVKQVESVMSFSWVVCLVQLSQFNHSVKQVESFFSFNWVVSLIQVPVRLVLSSVSNVVSVGATFQPDLVPIRPGNVKRFGFAFFLFKNKLNKLWLTVTHNSDKDRNPG